MDISDPMMPAPAAAAAISSTTSSPPWSVLLPELLSEILTHLRPADVACFRVVCRAWHSAARHYQVQLPWVVLPNGSFGTMTGDFFRRVPGGLPDDNNNVTCLGASGSWLALDRTDDVFRRTNLLDMYDSTKFEFLKPRCDVRHKHSYLLYNPFTGRTMPLPELDSIAGDVPETFEIRKVVLMRGSFASRLDDDDLVAIITNNRNYTMIICRPGKGRWVLPYLGIMDIVFFGDALYGMTMDGDLLVFELAPPPSAEEEEEKKKNGKPMMIVSRFKRVISHPLADDGEEEDVLSWMDNYVTIDDDETIDDDDELLDDENGDDDDDDVMMVEDGVVILKDEEMPHEPKDHIVITRHLVVSCDGKELLMVRHEVQLPPFDPPAYTRKVEIFKADMDVGRWVPVVTANALSQGEALFLSRASSMATRAYGDIKEGFVYFVDIDDAFDTRSGTRSPVSLPRQRQHVDGKWLTWVFPPHLVL